VETSPTEQLEASAFSFMIQLARDDPECKRLLGKRVLPVCHRKLGGPLRNGAKLFKLIATLVKRCKDNISIVKGGMREALEQHARDPALANRV
jgi:hypothetical protein